MIVSELINKLLEVDENAKLVTCMDLNEISTIANIEMVECTGYETHLCLDIETI